MLEMEAVQYKGFHNLYENGEAVGFQVCIRFVAYRGPWLSQFRFKNITVDGDVYGPEDCTFTIGGIEYTYDELMNEGFVKWQLNDVGIVKIKKPGGLGQGSHKVSASFSTIASYLPPVLDDMGGYAHEEEPRELIIV